MCLVTHIHTNTDAYNRAHTHTITHSRAALQQWEERATVTNSFAATKVAGNLSNRTIKLQLSFFSFLQEKKVIIACRVQTVNSKLDIILHYKVGQQHNDVA